MEPYIIIRAVIGAVDRQFLIQVDVLEMLGHRFRGECPHSRRVLSQKDSKISYGLVKSSTVSYKICTTVAAARFVTRILR